MVRNAYLGRWAYTREDHNNFPDYYPNPDVPGAFAPGMTPGDSREGRDRRQQMILCRRETAKPSLVPQWTMAYNGVRSGRGVADVQVDACRDEKCVGNRSRVRESLLPAVRQAGYCTRIPCYALADRVTVLRCSRVAYAFFHLLSVL